MMLNKSIIFVNKINFIKNWNEFIPKVLYWEIVVKYRNELKNNEMGI